MSLRKSELKFAYKQCPLCSGKYVSVGEHLERKHNKEFKEALRYLRAKPKEEIK